MLSAPMQLWGASYPIGTALSAAPVAAGLICAVIAACWARQRWARLVLVLVTAGWAHVAALELLGTIGSAWYYGPLISCSAAAVAVTIGRTRWRVGAGAAALVAAAAAAGVMMSGPPPWTWSPVVANMARTDQYAAIAAELPALTGGQPVQGPGEVGAFAFYSRVPVLDVLTDPSVIDQALARRRSAAGPLARTVLDLSSAHRHRSPAHVLRFHLSYASTNPHPDGTVVKAWPVDTPVRNPDIVMLTRTD